MNDVNHEIKINKDFESFAFLLLQEMGYIREDGEMNL